MSGFWILDKNNVDRLIANPIKESFEQKEPPQPGTATAPGTRSRVLVYLPATQVIRSYTDIQQKLAELDWSRYHKSHQPNLRQFHKSDESSHLLSLPTNFANFRSLHMYYIVIKNRSFFEVRDLNPQNNSNRTHKQVKPRRCMFSMYALKSSKKEWFFLYMFSSFLYCWYLFFVIRLASLFDGLSTDFSCMTVKYCLR